jgi:hypothetical protein
MSKILIKRSNISGRIPLTSDLDFGELAINTFSGKMYLKINDGNISVVELGDAITSLGFTPVNSSGGVMSGDLGFNGNRATGLGAPVNLADATTKNYVDNLLATEASVVRTVGDQSISGNKTFSNNVTVTGNFTVDGTTTTVNSATLSVSDSEIILNSDLLSGAPVSESGIKILRGDQAATRFYWDETSQAFIASIAGSKANISAGSIVATSGFVGNLQGNAASATQVTGVVAITNGGTGGTTVTEAGTALGFPVINPVAADAKTGDIKVEGNTISICAVTNGSITWYQIFPAIYGPNSDGGI